MPKAAHTSPFDRSALPGARTLRERVGALRNLPPFLRLVWRTSPALTSPPPALLRLVRALLPVATLYVGKLIIDEVVRLAGAPSRRGHGTELAESVRCCIGCAAGRARVRARGAVRRAGPRRVAARCAAVRALQQRDQPPLMEHAATLDLEDFEDAELQDRLERARRQAAGRRR